MGRRAPDDAERLTVPRSGRRRRLPAGQPVLDALAKGIGTGTFVALQTVVLVAWIGINVWVPGWRWDYTQPYPLILLTLVISAQAAYAAPLILLNQNRQTDVDRTRIARDRAEAKEAEAGTAYVIAELADLRAAVAKAMTRDVVRQEIGELRGRVRDVGTTPTP